jgi:osmotically-inducible protein OsmY
VTTAGAGTHAEPGDDAPDYQVARVTDALVHDGRTAELGVTVTWVGGAIVLEGAVASAARRADIVEVATDAAGGRPVRDELHVVEHTPPEAVEDLA